MAPSRVELAERLERLTIPEPNSGCLLWLGAIDIDGYSHITVRDHATKTMRSYRAHRLTYELVNGAIPADKQLDHLCRVRSCVNPKHLEVVTLVENLRRGAGAECVRRQNAQRRAEALARDACVNGHKWTEATTYRPPRSPLTRICRVCSVNSTRAYVERLQRKEIS